MIKGLKGLLANNGAFFVSLAVTGVLWVSFLVIGSEYHNWGLTVAGLICFALFWIFLCNRVTTKRD